MDLNDDIQRVTVVTVVFNGAAELEKTILSVINQSYKNLEYIVIDGGSTDGTIDIIKKYDNKIACWISEHDKGIYDAMNKGITLASGNWINFMNSGDVFAHDDVVKTIFKRRYTREQPVIYGDVKVKYNEFSLYVKARNLSNFWRGMPFCHQSSFASTKLMKEIQFDLEFRLASDFNFFYKLWKNSCAFVYVPFAFAEISSAGISDKNRIRVIEEYEKTVTTNNSNYKYKLYFKIYRLNIKLRGCIKSLLSEKITSRFIRMRQKNKNR